MKQTEKTQRTVAKILQAALREFGTYGYAGGTVNRICESGINKGLLYHNFEGKDDLYLACLDISCKKLLSLIEKGDALPDLLTYMACRMRFLKDDPDEAHIFFEAILQPQEHLQSRIEEILRPFEEVNERIYRATIAALPLRAGVTEEEAVAYFRQMQRMFNGYFTGPAYRRMTADEQIREHEENLPKLLHFMLYGIARGEGEE